MPWYTNPDWWSAIGQWVGGIGTVLALYIALKQINETKRLQYDLLKPELVLDCNIQKNNDMKNPSSPVILNIKVMNVKQTPVYLEETELLSCQFDKDVYRAVNFWTHNKPMNIKTGDTYTYEVDITEIIEEMGDSKIIEIYVYHSINQRQSIFGGLSKVPDWPVEEVKRLSEIGSVRLFSYKNERIAFVRSTNIDQLIKELKPEIYKNFVLRHYPKLKTFLILLSKGTKGESS